MQESGYQPYRTFLFAAYSGEGSIRGEPASPPDVEQFLRARSGFANNRPTNLLMSYCLYIGKNVTADGCAYLAGYGDEPSSHWLEIVPRCRYGPTATIPVGVTPDAEMPGLITEIPQVPLTARHIRVSYSYYRGAPAPITNGGLNEYGVAVRDVWSPSRPELIAITPPDQTGPNYSDLARLVLERAESAREGVQLIGDLIAQHGYSTYGGNSHFIADQHEGWVVIEFAGGQGLWAAERIGPDGIRVSRPGYISEIPRDFQTHDDFMGPDHLIDFAISQGWASASATEPFNVNQIYGDGQNRWAGTQWMEEEMARRAVTPEKITLQDLMWAVRTPKLTGDTAGYGQVVPLAGWAYPELATLWHSPVGAVAAPFTPFYMGTGDVPPEFKQHRYLTTGESARFVDARRKPVQRSHVPHGIESTRSAFYLFKRLLYLIMRDADRFVPEVTSTFNALEGQLISAQFCVIQTAQTLLDANQTILARNYLTYYSQTEAMRSLNLAESLVNSLDARIQIEYGVRESFDYDGTEQIW